MATFSRQTVKLVAALSSVPALGATVVGLRLCTVHAEEAKQEGKAPHRVLRACELPLYNTANENNVGKPQEVYPRNAVEQSIGVVRANVWDLVVSGMDAYETLKDSAKIGIEHTKSSIEFVQSNPGDLPRYVFIAVAGMGGVVLGYRGGVLRKVFYSSLAIGSSTALCYPKTTVELSSVLGEEVSSLWKEVGGKDLVDQYWPFGGEKRTIEEMRPNPSPPQPSSGGPPIEDPGQSNPKDKDMYSTRS